MVCCCSCWVLLVAIAALVIWLWKAPPPKKIAGVYTQPNRTYYLKVAVFYAFVSLRRWQTERRQKKTGKISAGYGSKSRANIEEMECCQELSDHPKAIDAVYFSGANSRGDYFVMSAARRPSGVVNSSLYLRIPEVGMLVLPRMPDTILFGDGDGYAAEGLTITPVSPMKCWKLDYTGKMRLESDKDDGSKLKQVNLKLKWSSERDYFDFDTDMHPLALARSMAKEVWSKEYFRALKEAHQTHYEHMGKLNGVVEIDGKTHDLKLDSLRDHSYGHKREWKLIHRYGLHMFHTECGMSITVGIVSQPVTCSHLELGYISKGDGSKISVSSVQMNLHELGENGSPPKDYSFSFIADGKQYLVEVNIEEAPEFYIGWEWETRICEYMATFKINGSKGWGIVEWAYRNRGGRPQDVAAKDPTWTVSLNKG